MILTVADQRSLTGVPAVFSWQPLDGDGLVATPGTITVDITRANGTVLVTAGATGGAASAPRTYTLAATNCALTDVLTAVWKDTGVERARTTLELVGGYYATIPQIRASDPTLGDNVKFPDVDVIRARTEVEHAFAGIAGTDFTPRYHIERLNGSNTTSLELGWGPLRSVRAVTIYYSGANIGVALTAAQLAAIPAVHGCIADRTDGGIWTGYGYGAGVGNGYGAQGRANIVIEYEAGYSTLPFDLRDQFFIEVRKQLNDTKSTIQLATTYDYDGGPAVDPALTAQQRRLYSTLMRYSLKIPGVG